MRHPPLAEYIKILVQHKQHLDNFINESRILKAKLEQILVKLEGLIEYHNTGQQLKEEIIETLNSINTDIENYIIEKRALEEKISILLAA